jgi:hypothetical protein
MNDSGQSCTCGFVSTRWRSAPDRLGGWPKTSGINLDPRGGLVMLDQNNWSKDYNFLSDCWIVLKFLQENINVVFPIVSNVSLRGSYDL